MDALPPPPASEVVAPREPSRQSSVVAGYSTTLFYTGGYGLQYSAASLGYHLWLSPGIEASAGGRVAFFGKLENGTAFDGWVALSLVPHFPVGVDQAKRTASWRPSLGIEVGYSTINRDPATIPDPENNRTVVYGGVFGGLAARPLRFKFNDIHASAAGITTLTMLAQPGRELRLQIELLQLGIVF